MINEDQTLPRKEALRLYTAANRWFLQESDIGTITPGALGDLVVLNQDYFDEESVSDEDIKKIRSVLTLVDGEIVSGDTDDL